MKRSLEDITSPQECDALIRELQAHRRKLLQDAHRSEVDRLLALSSKWQRELKSWKRLLGQHTFVVAGETYAVRRVTPKKLITMEWWDLAEARSHAFVVKGRGEPVSDFCFQWKKMKRVLRFARFLLRNFNLLE